MNMTVFGQLFSLAMTVFGELFSLAVLVLLAYLVYKICRFLITDSQIRRQQEDEMIKKMDELLILIKNHIEHHKKAE